MKDFLHHFFLPRESNNHRPKVLHHHTLLTVILSLFMLALLIPFLQRDFPRVLGISNNIVIQDLLSLTNQKRQENGLSPLKFNQDLSIAAEKKGENMLTQNYWAHIAPDGTTPWYFIKNSGYEYLYAGENLARGFSNANEIIEAWMQSPTHRENILSSNYNEVGFAVLNGKLTGSDTVLVVQMFGSKYISNSPDAEPSPAAIAQAVPTPKLAISPVQPKVAVASIQNQPIVNSKVMTRELAIFLLIVFIAVFIVDAIIIERKKIARVVSHNLDHILFLSILLIAAIIIGKGLIL